MKKLRCLPVVTSLLLATGSSAIAQNAIQLFGPTNVRSSQSGASDQNPVTFNSTTVNLTCSASPIMASLSSTPDGTGNVLVDNYMTGTPLPPSGPGTTVDICRGGTSDGSVNNCFNTTYENNYRGLMGQDLDSYAATGGIAPIDVSALITQSAGQTRFDLLDAGVVLANTSIYLVTNCTQAGVTGPAKVTGNPIPASNPTPAQLAQDFTFNPTAGQDIGFSYDLTTADADPNSQLLITDGTIPNTADTPLDPTLWLSQYATGTSFATTSCLIHTGELLPNGQSACKVYTLTCQVQTDPTSAGYLCPVSQIRNELFQDAFSGPAFTLPDITGPNGVTYHTGVGFLMAQDGWGGGSCSFNSMTGTVAEQDCPQNLLTNFTFQPEATPAVSALAQPALKLNFAVQPQIAAPKPSQGEDSINGTATRPNSTYIAIAQVPEDLTTVVVQGAHAGGWINNDSAAVTFSSQAPELPNTLANYQNFVASPIQSITYGVAPATTILSTTFAVPNDTTLLNPVVCPAPLTPGTAIPFLPAAQNVAVNADGQYLIHYFAQDCAGTEELKFVPTNGGFATTFYTTPFNVDTVPPVVASGPALSPAAGTVSGVSNSYGVGAKLSATYSCTDDASGVAACGTSTYTSPGTLNTGTLTTSNLDTSTPGMKTFTVQTTDIAGNIGTPTSVTYQVVGPQADLAVLGFAPGRAKSGSALIYDVAAVDLGPSAAWSVVITDTLPAGTTFVSAGFEDISCALFGGCSIPPQSTACTVTGKVVTCSVGSLKPVSLFSISGAAVRIVLAVNASVGTTLTNHVTVTSANPDKNPGNNSATQQTQVTR